MFDAARQPAAAVAHSLGGTALATLLLGEEGRRLGNDTVTFWRASRGDVYKSKRYQVSVSNTVREATGFRPIPTSIHKYPRSVSCHVPHCPIPSQHFSHRMRFDELPQNTLPEQHEAKQKNLDRPTPSHCARSVHFSGDRRSCRVSATRHRHARSHNLTLKKNSKCSKIMLWNGRRTCEAETQTPWRYVQSEFAPSWSCSKLTAVARADTLFVRYFHIACVLELLWRPELHISASHKAATRTFKGACVQSHDVTGASLQLCGSAQCQCLAKAGYRTISA